jgi:hypothetical protein
MADPLRGKPDEGVGLPASLARCRSERLTSFSNAFITSAQRVLS